MAYEDPKWAKVVEEEEEDQGNVFEEELDEKKKKKDAERNKELYCVLCGKKFKSEKQWKNHEQSKKHRDKVAEFRESIGEEEEVEEVVGRDEVDDGIEELGERVRDGFQIGEEIKISDSDEFYDVHSTEMGEDSVNDKFVSGNEDEEEDKNGREGNSDEVYFVEAMKAGCRNTNNVCSNNDKYASSTSHLHAESGSKEAEFMEYNNRKSGRKNRGTRRHRRNNGENEKDPMNGIGNDWNGESNEFDESCMDESSSHFIMDDKRSDKGFDGVAGNKKTSNQPIGKRGTSKKETNTKSKNISKGTKAKGSTKNSSNSWETCGEEFESRNKLHKHLGDTGHASLKHR